MVDSTIQEIRQMALRVVQKADSVENRVVLNWRVNNLKVVTDSSPRKMREEIAGVCPMEVILQDMETVYEKKDLLSTWVNIAREEREKIRG